ncbi:MAG: NAD-dependent epimerase/dehydratase family protein [Myxococcota bacterium]
MADQETTTDAPPPPRTSVLVTGAEGYVGRLLVRALAADRRDLTTLVAADVREPSERVDGVEHEVLDIRDADAVDEVVRRHGIDTVVHLAAVVTPGPGQGRDFQYAVDVEGTGHLLDACLAHGVRKLVFTSSGAAYGYHADNPALLIEDDPLRGNQVFAYAWHKRLVEERLATLRDEHSDLDQLIFRVSTILGPSVHNQITDLFERPAVVGLAGVDTPFCFISDADVVTCLAEGVHGEQTGVVNLTGDGAMTLREIAAAMERPFVPLPAEVLRKGLGVLDRLGVSPYGPEQVMFLQYRPVLDNRRLKEAFPGLPTQASRQVFERYRATRAPGLARHIPSRPRLLRP